LTIALILSCRYGTVRKRDRSGVGIPRGPAESDWRVPAGVLLLVQRLQSGRF
jgi:hypothetical protein